MRRSRSLPHHNNIVTDTFLAFEAPSSVAGPLKSHPCPKSCFSSDVQEITEGRGPQVPPQYEA